MLGADVVVAELERFAQAELENLLGSRGERDVTAGGLLTLADDVFDLPTDGFERDVEALERLGGDALTFVDETEEDVFGADVVVAEHPRFLLREHHNAPSAIGKPFEHETPLDCVLTSSLKVTESRRILLIQTPGG